MSSDGEVGKSVSRSVGKSAGKASADHPPRNFRLSTPDSRLRLGGVLQQAILILASLVALFPLWFMVWTAFRRQDDYFRSPLGWPQGIHWDNFTGAFDENIGRWVLNSALVTGGAVLLVTLISVPAAYAFVRLPFKGSAFLLKIFVFLMVIPPIVMLLPLGRVNHVDSVIVAYAGLMFPFSVFMMTRYIETIPSDLYEAAFVEGASHARILSSIVVPLIVPALLTLGIVNALWAWNELLIAVVMLQREESRTLQAGLALLKGKNTMDIPLVMAGATISAVPLLLLYLFGQRVFMSGLLAGAVKE
ncbi:MAG: binding-protein-dependent transport system inner rane component [Thermomicrobiales bacterium]|nr:binding-protein-dependent transport system inner rane component [Thermomicrobiales bacterium]